MHVNEKHNIKHSCESIIESFDVDEHFFKMLVETMYEGEEEKIPSRN